MKNKFKLKPTQAARGGGGGGGGGAGSRALANKRSFSLVFLLNTIDEEKVRETLKRNPKVENSLLHKAAKKGFKAGFNPIPQEDEFEEEDQKSAGEPADDGSSSSEEEEEEEDNDEELISSAEEVYLDNIRNNLSLREQLRDIGGNVLTNWDHLEEPRDIDHLLSIVSHIFDFTYEKEKTTEPTEYYSRFNVNFLLLTDFSYIKFEALLSVLHKLLSYEKFRKYSVEVPFDVIHRQKINLEADPLRKDTLVWTQFYVRNAYLGSQVNLSQFYCHFKLPVNADMAKVRMVAQMHFLKKYLILYFMLDSRGRVHKLYYSFSSFRTLILEWHPTFTRVYLDCLYAPIMNYTDLSPWQTKDLNLQETDLCDISGLERRWMRAVRFKYLNDGSTNGGGGGGGHNHSQRGNKNGNRNGRGQAHQHNSIRQPADEHLLGMARTLCLDVPHDNPELLPCLVRMAYLCRERIKSFQFYLATIEPVHRWPQLSYNAFQERLNAQELPFAAHFALLVLFSDSYRLLDVFAAEGSLELLLDTVEDYVYQLKAAEWKSGLARLEQALYLLKTACREAVILHPYTELLRLLKNINSIVIEEEERPEYVTIRRATLYPSHLELVQPVSLLRSRFSDLADLEYGLRMTFADDNGGVLNKVRDFRERDFILEVMKPKLKDGLRIGPRTYEMLGSSTSQMRDSGCTLYAVDRLGRNAERVRQSAGALGKFRSASKYIARFGLVFSQSMTIIPLESDVVVEYAKDILGAVKPGTKDFANTAGEQYILSDGIGVVDTRVAQRWQPYLQVKNDYFPSAYQIRLGGCKGMLTAYPVDRRRPLTVVIRDSMKKYESDSRAIGILKYSMPRPVYLNRPLINILDHMEVDRDELYAYYYRSTSSVVKATLYDACAMDLIHTYSSGLLPYEKILNAGVSLLDEPFLRDIINYLIYYRLNFELKLKARIRVPNDAGRIAFGVLDELGVLEYGQIFFQYTKLHPDGRMEADQTVVLQGEVMVTKFPCLQPGDVRKFTAVDHPRLRHLKDCLVFPSRGERSHCDEMSGSDLDGDEYAIIFDRKLYFPGSNRPAMDFPYGLNSNQSGSITIGDMVEFFLRYLMMNNIGVVANTHLMYSDFLPDGLDDPDCENLAYLYNISLDFPKTGVIMPMPRRDCTLAIRPDFMERNNFDQVYLSKKMLGEYFRHCSLVERAIELSRHDYRFTSPTSTPTTMEKTGSTKRRGSLPPKTEPSTWAEAFQSKQHGKQQSFIKNKLILPGWRKFYKQANDALTEYRIRVVNLMEQLEVENEVMLFADVYEEKKDVSKVLLDRLFAHFQQKFAKQCAALRCTASFDRLLLTSAWYAICHEKSGQHSGYNGRPLLGLPWLVAGELCQLAQYSFSGKVATEAELAATVRRVVSPEGEIFTVQTGLNHKQVVPYSLPAALLCDMLFDYRSMVVYGTEVVHHYWCPYTVVSLLRRDHPRLLPLFYGAFEEIQLRLVLRMLMKFFDVLKRRVYGDEDRRKVIRFPQEEEEEEVLDRKCPGGGGAEAKATDVKEGVVLFRIVSKLLKEIVASCGRKTTDGLQSLPTVSTLFNRVLYHLFDVLNRVNAAVHHATLEELFLTKYAVFALSFLNRIDTKLDRRFYLDVSMKMLSNWSGQVAKFAALERHGWRQWTGSEDQLAAGSPFLPNDVVSDYETALEVLFNSYLLDNSFLVTETISFYLPPMENRINILEEQDELARKLVHLSGVTSVAFRLSTDQTWGSTAEETAALLNDQEDEEGREGDPAAKDDSETKPSPANDPFEELRQRCYSSQKSPPKEGGGSLIGKLSYKSDVLKTVPYEVTTTGLVHSTQILRLLIGHPSFFPKIYPLFEICSIDD